MAHLKKMFLCLKARLSSSRFRLHKLRSNFQTKNNDDSVGAFQVGTLLVFHIGLKLVENNDAVILRQKKDRIFLNQTLISLFKNGPTPASFFVYFCSFQTQNLQKKTVGFSGIRTRIVRVEGKHADHQTTTTAL